MVATTLSQSILAGMDPSTYRNIQDIQSGDEYTKTGMDSSPTTGWGAAGRLANALAGAYITNSATSDLAKTIANGKKSAGDTLLAALTPQAKIPSGAPTLSDAAPASSFLPKVQPEIPSAQPQETSGSPASTGATVAANPLDTAAWPAGPVGAPGHATVAANPLDTAAWPAGPVGAPGHEDAGPVAAINSAIAPRGIRNNNPLNIEDGPFTKSQAGYAGSDGRFAKFETPEHGVAAASALLDSYGKNHGLNSVAGIVGRWAPTSDGNNVSSYAADVAGRLGIDPNAPVPPEMRPQLIAAMAQHENGRAAPGTVSAPGAPQAPYQVAGPATAAPQAKEAPDPSEGLGVSQLLQVLHHPYASDEEKALASKLLVQRLSPKEDEFAAENGIIYNKRTGEVKPGTQKPDEFVSSPQGIFNKRTGELKQSPGGAGSDFGGLQGKDLLTAVQKANPAVGSQVTAIIEGRAPYPTGSRLNPVQQQVKELVTQVDPTFEAGNSGARIKVRNEFAGGGPNSPAGAITAGNTAIQHLGHLSDEAEKLGNFDSGIPGNNLVNEAKNAISRSAGGGVAASNFDSIRNKYIEEATKFYRGTGGNESDLQRDIAALNSAQSPSQLRDVIKTQSDLMQSKVNALQERWKHGMGPMVEDFPIIQPESQAAIDRINKRQAGGSDAKTGPASTSPAPGAPAVGAVMKGHKFLGGDPSSPSSWQAVQ